MRTANDPPASRPRPARIEDVAQAAGVSVATVSRALRGLPNVAESTRLRVLEVAAVDGLRTGPCGGTPRGGQDQDGPRPRPASRELVLLDGDRRRRSRLQRVRVRVPRHRRGHARRVRPTARRLRTDRTAGGRHRARQHSSDGRPSRIAARPGCRPVDDRHAGARVRRRCSSTTSRSAASAQGP